MVNRVAGNYFWAAAGRFGTMALSFVFNLVLARWYLTPRDFGIIGMLQIFLSVGATTMIGGFGQALVQKEHLRKSDVNTVFTFNVLVALLFYFLLYIFAPQVAVFYREPVLVSVLRVLSLVLVVNSLFVVQYNLALRYQSIRKLNVVALVSTGVGYLIGFVLAYKGLGVWSLVGATLSISLLQVVLLWTTSEVFPGLRFSKDSFRSMIPFSGYIYLATLVEQLYSNALSVIMGRRFKAVTLGYYTQANKLQGVPASGMQEVAHQVLLPEFSRYQRDSGSLRDKYMSNLQFLTLVAAWAFSALYIVAEPAVRLLYTDKWLPSVPMLKVLCPAGFFFVLYYIPTLLIRALGKARSYFLLLLAEYSVAIGVMIYLSSSGVYPVLYGLVGVNALCFFVNALYLKHLGLGISLWAQLKVVIPLVLAFGVLAWLTQAALMRLDEVSMLWQLGAGIIGPSVLFCLLYTALHRATAHNGSEL